MVGEPQWAPLTPEEWRGVTAKLWLVLAVTAAVVLAAIVITPPLFGDADVGGSSPEGAVYGFYGRGKVDDVSCSRLAEATSTCSYSRDSARCTATVQGDWVDVRACRP